MHIRWFVWCVFVQIGGACFESMPCLFAPCLFAPCLFAQGQVVKPNDGEAQENLVPDGDIITIDFEGRIERRLDANLEASYAVDLSGFALEGARKYRLKLRIVNPFDEAIGFSRVSLSCGCAKFEAKQKEIPALGAADFLMDVDVPNQIGLPLDRITATFFSANSYIKPNLTLNVTYSLNGVFGFQSDRAIVELPKTEAVVVARFPIVLVEPVTLDKLELKYSQNLRDFNIRIVADDPESSLPYINVEVPREGLPREGMTGEVGVRRIGSNQVAGVIVSFRHQEPFALRPESVRLSRDNHSKPYQAFAMLRCPETDTVEEEGGKDGDKKKSLALPEVALSIDGKPANVLVQRLGRIGLYRLTIQHDGPFEADSDGKLNVRWRVLVNGEERVIESYAFLSDN